MPEKSKKERIAEFYRENPEVSSTKVAEVFDTDPSYARRCKPDDLKRRSPADAVAAGEEVGQDPEPEGSGPSGDVERISDDPEENPMADLLIEDTHDTYTCGDCDAEVEYLQKECHECEEALMWYQGAKA